MTTQIKESAKPQPKKKGMNNNRENDRFVLMELARGECTFHFTDGEIWENVVVMHIDPFNMLVKYNENLFYVPKHSIKYYALPKKVPAKRKSNHDR